jgi:hypothetical protein
MGTKINGVDSPEKVNGVTHPAKVQGVSVGYGDPYWPVTGVTKPLHLWPFSQTGDYTDQGSSATKLNLTAQGSENSFGAGGLILNGSGWAISVNNAEVSDLGGTFSVLLDIYFPSTPYGIMFSSSDNGSGTGIQWWDWSGTLTQRSLNSGAEDINTAGFTTLTNYQLIWVQSDGKASLYRNGSQLVNEQALHNPAADVTNGITIGAGNPTGSYKIACTVKRAAVDKGTAWTAPQVAAIYAALP